MKRIHPTHAPALARQEAALLPAMRRGLPRNLLPPMPNLRFRPAVEETPASALQAEPAPPVSYTHLTLPTRMPV